MECYSHFMEQGNRVGVLDKSVALLSALELGPLSLAELAEATGLPKPTAHRLALALVGHGLVHREESGLFELGPRISELASAMGADRLAVLARPVLMGLRDVTGESAQLYQRRGDMRVCVAGADRTQGLRDTVPVGAVLTMAAGSAAQVLQAWQIEPRGPAAAFSARTLADVRRRGYAHSIAEREPGVASVSAPVHGATGTVIAALSVSGPVERLGPSQARRLGPLVISAATDLSAAVAQSR